MINQNHKLTVDPYSVLNKSIQLLEMGWVSSHEAVDIDSHNVLPWDESAVRWCVLGSVRACTYLLDQDNEPYNTNYIMTVITTANPALMTKDHHYKQYGYVEDENDHSSQQRAIQMVRNAMSFIMKHPPKVATIPSYAGNPKYDR